MRKLVCMFFVLATFLFASDHMNHEGMKHDHSQMKAMDYRAVKVDDATILQSGKEKSFCPICGMTLPMFYKTNHAATVDGKTKQYCSVHCMIEDEQLNQAKISEEKVVDNTTLKFIDVKTATYVVGSSKPGTMSPVSKYAFSNKAEAEKFATENGGEVKTYSEVYEFVKKSLAKEKAMIEQKQAKMAMMGEKIYNKMCKKTDMKFNSTAEAKAYVTSENLCGNIGGKELQAVGLYLGKK